MTDRDDNDSPATEGAVQGAITGGEDEGDSPSDDQVPAGPGRPVDVQEERQRGNRPKATLLRKRKSTVLGQPFASSDDGDDDAPAETTDAPDLGGDSTPRTSSAAEDPLEHEQDQQSSTPLAGVLSKPAPSGASKKTLDQDSSSGPGKLSLSSRLKTLTKKSSTASSGEPSSPETDGSPSDESDQPPDTSPGTEAVARTDDEPGEDTADGVDDSAGDGELADEPAPTERLDTMPFDVPDNVDFLQEDTDNTFDATEQADENSDSVHQIEPDDERGEQPTLMLHPDSDAESEVEPQLDSPDNEPPNEPPDPPPLDTDILKPFAPEKLDVPPTASSRDKQAQPADESLDTQPTAGSGPQPVSNPGAEQRSTDLSHGGAAAGGPAQQEPPPDTFDNSNKFGAEPAKPTAPPPEHHRRATGPPTAAEPASPPGVDPSSSPPASDSPSEDFEAGDTELFDSPYENDPICPRLTVLEGPAVGHEFLVDEIRNSVGRGTSNAVVVPDPAMSRRHFEIIRNQDDSYEIYDLMAVNGTTLNGVGIKEADLFHGDRVEAGQTVFQFLIPGDTKVSSGKRRMIRAERPDTHPPGQEDSPVVAEPTSTFDKILLGVTIVAGIACIPLIAVLAHALFFAGSDADGQASHYYFEGVDAVQTAQWSQAEQLFEKSRDADPDFGAVDAQFERIDEERRARDIIEQAREHSSDGLDAEIVDQLRTISRDSHYYEEARSLLSLARHDEAQQLFDSARRAYEQEQFEEAILALDELSTLAPEHEQAEGLERDIHTALEEKAEPQQEQEPDRQPTAAAPPDPEPADDTDTDTLDELFVDDLEHHDDDHTDGATVGSINFTDGYRLYRSREFDEAIEHFESISRGTSGTVADRAGSTAEDIKAFRQSLQTGRQALDEGQLDDALEQFRAAGRADEAVAGEAGSFEDDITGYIAEVFARQAQQRLDAQDYSTAYDLYQRARAHDPEHEEVETLREQLEEQAHSLYIQASHHRQSGERDLAAELGETILTMVPPGSEAHDRARNLIEELD